MAFGHGRRHVVVNDGLKVLQGNVWSVLNIGVVVVVITEIGAFFSNVERMMGQLMDDYIDGSFGQCLKRLCVNIEMGDM